MLLGVWLFVSPWVLDYGSIGRYGVGPPNSAYAVSGGPTPWNSWIVGGIIFFVALAAATNPWAEWINMGAGIWLCTSPWVLGFSWASRVAWNDWIVGALVFFLALWAWWAGSKLSLRDRFMGRSYRQGERPPAEI